MIENMNKEYIKIFIDRLLNEGEFSQKGTLEGDILELKEGEGKAFNLCYDLKAYITDGHLLITFDTSCDITRACKICNENTSVSIKLKKQTHSEPIEEIKKGAYEASVCIRDAILLALPEFVECGGNCPEREFVKKFLKSQNSQAETYQPFQGL